MKLAIVRGKTKLTKKSGDNTLNQVFSDDILCCLGQSSCYKCLKKFSEETDAAPNRRIFCSPDRPLFVPATHQKE